MGKYFDRLTVEQQQLPYAKFIDFPYSQPPIPPAVQASILAPMDPEKALRIERADSLLDASYAADDMGYCLLEDGSGYVGETIHFPQCSRNMFEWWFSWTSLNDVRYQIWDPEAHIAAAVSSSQLARRIDVGLPYAQRFVGTTNFTVHRDAAGNGDPGTMYFISPEMFGLRPDKIDDKISLVIALHGKADTPYPTMSSIRVLRDTENGFVMRLYFWHGKCVVNGRVLTIPGAVPDIAGLGQFAAHAGQEYQHLADILPQLYAENHARVDDPASFRTLPF